MTAHEHTRKRYRCRRCGHVTEQVTNHYGPTWSIGRYNVCPQCPPWAKYPEFGSKTDWDCLDVPPLDFVAAVNKMLGQIAKGPQAC